MDKQCVFSETDTNIFFIIISDPEEVYPPFVNELLNPGLISSILLYSRKPNNNGGVRDLLEFLFAWEH
jgi:hypothetical protein